MTTTKREDTTFCVREGEHQIRLNGKVLPTTWNSLGAALAGIAVERRRAEKRAALERSRARR